MWVCMCVCVSASSDHTLVCLKFSFLSLYRFRYLFRFIFNVFIVYIMIFLVNKRLHALSDPVEVEGSRLHKMFFTSLGEIGGMVKIGQFTE